MVSVPNLTKGTEREEITLFLEGKTNVRRSELKSKLKSLHRGLTVIRYSNRERHTHGGNDAVYFYTQNIGAVPPGAIYAGKREGYRSEKGYIHRSLNGLRKLLWSKGRIRYGNQAVRSVFAR